MKPTTAYVLAIFMMSLFVGIIIISIGLGTEFTLLNTVMAPLVCPGDKIVPAWEYDGPLDIGYGPDLGTRWICVNKLTGEARIAGYRTIFTAGTVYALLITIIAVVSMRRSGFDFTKLPNRNRTET